MRVASRNSQNDHDDVLSKEHFDSRQGTAIWLSAVGLMALAVLAGCGGSRQPEPLPSQTVTKITPQLEPPPAPPPLPPVREVQPTRTTVKVIEQGGEPNKPLTLLEASQLARAQKQNAPPPVAEINDENLAEYAAGGDIIILTSEPAAPAPQLQPNAAPPTAAAASELPVVTPDGLRDEKYWRSRAIELRMGWRRAVDLIEELELENAALRQQFYAEEDDYLRDTQIKPSWDRVLDRLEQLRERSQRYEQDLESFVEEGRLSGAQQGWLNEGWELEPTAEEKTRLEKIGAHQSIDVPAPNDPNQSINSQ